MVLAFDFVDAVVDAVAVLSTPSVHVVAVLCPVIALHHCSTPPRGQHFDLEHILASVTLLCSPDSKHSAEAQTNTN